MSKNTLKRLCFLSPDLEHAQAVVKDLKSDGIKEERIFALAKSKTALAELPSSNYTDNNDFIPALERGVAIGGATGVLAGLIAVAFPPSGVVLGGGSLLLIGVMGASLSGVLTGMAGSAYPNSRLTAFEKDIEAGKILIMVDVAKARLEHVNDLIKRLDPEVIVEGIEPPAPIIPK